jgi:ArsR family transcriptional regulator
MNTPAIFEDLTTLADATRGRMLLILERQELTVSELCAVLQLPQSTVSRHLKTLADSAWVTSRRDGTSRYYTLALDERDAHTRRLWSLLREQIAVTPGADQDARRLKGVLGRRQSKSEEFFASAAGQWDRLRRELFGGASALHALPALLDSSWIVGDLRCGTGETSAALAPSVARTIAVDRSGDAAGGAPPAARRAGRRDPSRRSQALPIAGRARRGGHDARPALRADPGAALREAARTLKPGGRLVVCDMLPHDREEYKQQMGHVWLGFGDDQLRRLLAAAGFDHVRVVPLPVDPHAKGPALFAASAVKHR